MDGSSIMQLSWMVLLCTVVCSTATRDEMVYALRTRLHFKIMYSHDLSTSAVANDETTPTLSISAHLAAKSIATILSDMEGNSFVYCQHAHFWLQ